MFWVKYCYTTALGTALHILTGYSAAVGTGRAPGDGLTLSGNADLGCLKHRAELQSCLGSLCGCSS